ncbi:M42 family metallopeptidase [Phocaeicola coprocola]|mgnify:CR=1 FL=1|uniref:M42 family metallopeptidase n=1 Tax=Phocaeicola coprocola TaxID=310298 RepID=UPI003AEF5DAA
MEITKENILKDLLMTPSPSGSEQPIIKKMAMFLKDYIDELTIDNYGNLIALKYGANSNKKLMLAAHADEVGMMVTHIDNNGFLSFQEIGGIDTNLLPGQRVEIHNHQGVVTGIIGKKPIHLQDRDAKAKDYDAEDLWIDIAAKDKEEAESKVEVGDYITYQTQPVVLQHDVWTSKALDDKVGLLTLVEVAKALDGKQPAMDVYFVASVQEELGARGIRTAALGINPDYGIAIDVTHATDYPTCSPQKSGEIKVGNGIVIAKGPNINKTIGRKLIDLAKQQNIKYQIEPIARPTGTDANFMQVSGTGVKTALLSIPCRYMHSPNEIVSLVDVNEGVRLLTHFCDVELDK